jgi:glucose-6-phosphate isomerase
MLYFRDQQATPFYGEDDAALFESQLKLAFETVEKKSGAGSEFLGWHDLPENIDCDELSRVKAAAGRIAAQSDIFVVVGIGGSYLGARAVIEALGPSLSGIGKIKRNGHPLVLYAGHHLSAKEHVALEELLGDYDFTLNVISKSGTTTEPAIAFRRLRALAEKKYGEKEAASRIITTTDRNRGALRQLAVEKGYETFVVPDDIGGRYSVLTPVGLLPIAAAGLNIDALLDGAKSGQDKYANPDLKENDVARYVLARNILLRRGYVIELLVNYEPGFHYLAEWWKQLFGESEGKNGRGLFPAAVDNTTDLHSMGQYIQDGRRFLFETVIEIENDPARLDVPGADDDSDGLNYLAGKELAWVNRQAIAGTALAHVDGGVPNLRILLKNRDERALGELIYFFEKACAVSGYLNAVNPFNQPGVEDYKVNMFALLGKPGFEERGRELKSRL